MSSDFLPPASTSAAKPFEVTDAKINWTSAALGSAVVFVIYPAYELLRYWWGANPSMFSWSSTITAVICGLLFGANVRRRVRSLARNVTEPE